MELLHFCLEIFELLIFILKNKMSYWEALKNIINNTDYYLLLYISNWKTKQEVRLLIEYVLGINKRIKQLTFGR
jgi:hypothetical protein